MRAARLLPLLLLAVAASRCFAQYEYDYGYGYGYDFYDTEDDFYYDEYGYYGDEDEAYYEYYGYYADDFAGYEDYYMEEYDFFEECFFDTNGKPVLANGTASCDIKVKGVDKQADRLKGGLDGVYQLTSCYNGKPMYKRKNSPAGDDRVLWYSSTFGDWDVSKGAEPNEAEILMYGGEMEHASVPLFVGSWHLGGDLRSDTALGEDDYLPINVAVSCADGTVYKADEVNTYKQFIGPVLTDEEIEAKYQYIYDKYSRADPSPTINFTFVVLLVMTGLTIVLAIPYFLLRKKGAKGGSISMSFAQMLSQSKKKSTGHIN
ncbi:hypothetical protein HXX76_011009 [Chlamydomonas incerta]|uniref:Uncharacterized protein n=1 Tax=Chlamydomonas incerta TaxID=51695 RepID=A0A835SYR6_CHLIN|nr:hypothetical protein HXX76_011009 [Chlamydomonas incerta]|eukprot:KAG2429240.1 hypothetical protein HXX76_011009 [Chlamydomonas incerta]